MEENIMIKSFSKLVDCISYSETHRHYTIVAQNWVYDSNAERQSVRFLSIPTETIYKEYIKKNENQSVFNILHRDERLIYFDVDKQKIKQSDLLNTIQIFLNQLSELLNLKITIDDMMIFTKSKLIDGVDYIDSFHLVSIKFSMNRKDIKSLVEIYNGNDNRLFKLDNKVYDTNRQFCCCDNGKLEFDHNKLEFKVNRVFKYNSINVVDESNKYNLIDNISTNHININIENLIKKFKKNKMNEPRKIHTNDILDYVYNDKVILQQLEDTRIWTNLCYIVKKNELDNCENFCEKTLGGGYTIDDNIKYWNVELEYNLKRNTIRYYSGDIIRFFEKYCNIKFITNTITEHLIDYTINKLIKSLPTIHTQKNEIFNQFNSQFQNRVNRDKVIPMNENVIVSNNGCKNTITKYKAVINVNGRKVKIIYDIVSGVVYSTISDELYPYYFDKVMETYEEKSKNMVYVNKDDFEKLVEKIIYSSNIIELIRGLWGVGKTHFIIEPIVKHYMRNNLNILFITENNCLNTEIKQRLSFSSHLDKSKNINYRYMVCSIESILKLSRIDFDYDLIVVDEAVSFFNHFKSTTINNARYVFKIIMKLMRNCPKIILCDADLTYDMNSSILTYLNDNKPYTIYHLNHNPYEDITFNIYEKKSLLLDYFYNCVDRGEKIGIAFSKKSELDSITYKLKNKYPNINIISITSDGVRNNDTLLDKTESYNVKKSINQYLIDNPCDVFMTSPSVSTGINIMLEHSINFNKMFGIFTPLRDNGANPYTFLQMIRRIRTLKDNSINIYCGKPSTNLKFYTMEEISLIKERNFNYVLSQSNKIENNLKVENDIDDLYWKMVLYNRSFDLTLQSNPLYFIYENLKDKKLKVKLIRDDDDVSVDNTIVKSDDFYNIDLREISISHIYEIIEKTESNEELEYSEQLLFNKLKLLVNGKFDFKHSDGNTKTKIFYGFFRLDILFKYYQIINTKEFLDYIKLHHTKFKNRSKFLHTESNLHYLENNEVYKSKVCELSKNIFIENIYKYVMNIYKSDGGLTDKTFKLTKELINDYKLHVDKKYSVKNFRTKINTLFKNYMGECFEYNYNNKTFTHKIIDLFYSEPNYEVNCLESFLNYSSVLDENGRYIGKLNEMVLMNEYKKDYKFTQRNNIIEGHLLLNKFSITKNYKRTEELFNENNVLEPYTKFKEYKIQKISYKLRKLLSNKSVFDKYADVNVDKNYINIYFSDMINGIKSSNLQYSFTNRIGLTIDETIDYEYDDIMKVFKDLMKMCEDNECEYKMVVNKKINKTKILMKMIKIYPHDKNDMITYSIDEDNITEMINLLNQHTLINYINESKSNNREILNFNYFKWNYD